MYIQRSDAETDKLNEAQLHRALADTQAFHDMQDGKGLDLETLAALPDLRPE
jgi:hypothetical protein